MRERPRAFVVVLMVLIGAGLPGALALSKRPRPTALVGREIGKVSAGEQAETFRFSPAIVPYDRQAILTAVGHARPGARRLLDVVDGLVDLEVQAAGPGAIGSTQTTGNRFQVTLNLGAAARAGGRRAIDRLVLHELGHVVRFALVPGALRDRLDAQVPRGYGCEDGVTGACAGGEEIFAESFAKWATGDIGVNLNLGYAVPPPSDLETWGAPLAALATAP